jgi:hypothetical protein
MRRARRWVLPVLAAVLIGVLALCGVVGVGRTEGVTLQVDSCSDILESVHAFGAHWSADRYRGPEQSGPVSGRLTRITIDIAWFRSDEGGRVWMHRGRRYGSGCSFAAPALRRRSRLPAQTVGMEATRPAALDSAPV